MTHIKHAGRQTRRGFLGTAAAAAFTTNLFTGHIRGANDRINVGFIGTGVRGGDGLIKMFLPQDGCQCVATCDAFKDRREQRAEEIDAFYAANRSGTYKSCAAYADFRELLERKDIDAVAIATPDHWHALIAIAAVNAGKDIYLEKPLALSLTEGKAVCDAVKKTGRIFQYGTQQRSSQHVRHGCELVRNGRIGKVHTVVVLAPCGSRGGSTESGPAPEGFDREMWAGPSPLKPYNDLQCQRNGHYHIYDNAIGYIAGWGAHPLDVAQWGLGTDDTSPVEYEGTGFVPKKGLFTSIPCWTVRCRYANGVRMDFMDAHEDLTRFIGTEGWVAVSRKSLDAEPRSLIDSHIGVNEEHLHESENHAQDFLDSVRGRKETVNPVESGLRSDAISHLSDIAIRTARKIKWDPVNETIIGDTAASKMMTRPMRAPWKL